MSSTPAHRWLGIAGYLTLVLAAIVAVIGLRSHVEERRRRNDIGVRAEDMMNRIEAEVQRLENQASAEDNGTAPAR